MSVRNVGAGRLEWAPRRAICNLVAIGPSLAQCCHCMLLEIAQGNAVGENSRYGVFLFPVVFFSGSSSH
jgi:hypothetical protein